MGKKISSLLEYKKKNDLKQAGISLENKIIVFEMNSDAKKYIQEHERNEDFEIYVSEELNISKGVITHPSGLHYPSYLLLDEHQDLISAYYISTLNQLVRQDFFSLFENKKAIEIYPYDFTIIEE
ncbi:hypothetical protein [Chengkuizengella sediminis]|uniref:hypothetical protein n=1 Tax=Chengkuizengella sediminis TaxID=1885917 RepID=UPI001389FF97|nr:hypothetical protein [Chengkuizengella sediminis]NDI37227.1 hypothetical protein [Chengkuizengella sediminis]